jgi:hypothetical protein
MPMKVRGLINYLEKYFDPEDHVVAVCWNQSDFEEAALINTAEWNACCEYMEDIDWHPVKQSLELALSECLEQMEDE